MFEFKLEIETSSYPTKQVSFKSMLGQYFESKSQSELIIRLRYVL